MPSNFQKISVDAISTLAVFCVTGLAVWACSTNSFGSMQRDGQRANVLSTSPEIDTPWRHTKFGWQDSATWTAAVTYTPRKTVELLHPFVWAGSILLFVIATMIWASSEWEIARLFCKVE